MSAKSRAAAGTQGSALWQIYESSSEAGSRTNTFCRRTSATLVKAETRYDVVSRTGKKPEPFYRFFWDVSKSFNSLSFGVRAQSNQYRTRERLIADGVIEATGDAHHADSYRLTALARKFPTKQHISLTVPGLSSSQLRMSEMTDSQEPLLNVTTSQMSAESISQSQPSSETLLHRTPVSPDSIDSLNSTDSKKISQGRQSDSSQDVDSVEPQQILRKKQWASSEDPDIPAVSEALFHISFEADRPLSSARLPRKTASIPGGVPEAR